MYDEADETKEESDVVAVLFFVREMETSFLDSSIYFFDDTYFCNVYFCEMDEVRRLRK